MKTGSILIVDDNKNVLSALRILLENYFQHVTLLSSPNQLPTKLREFKPDIVLLDMNFSAGINSGNEGLFWLSEIKKFDCNLPVVLFTAYADINLAVRALKEGASDFVVKPWDNARLVATLQAAFTLCQSHKNVNQSFDKLSVLSDEQDHIESICWGQSVAMCQLRKLMEKVATTDANILITGENGTGKEVIAREIHRLSSRNNQVLVTVDMGAVSETLFESELFGHVKGAFTDARADRAGKFEAANNGTLFLDEIGNLSYPLQAKLLSVIQSRKVVRVGDNKSIPVNIRLVCATNCDLELSVQNGEFREDLLYRVNTIHIEVPSLRERKADILELANFFLQKYATKYRKNNLTFAKQTISKLENYAWPGNVRELQHAIEKAVILCDEDELLPSDFYMKDQNTSISKIDTMSLEDAERLLISNSIKKNSANLSAVASELGITRPTLY
ncbi:MAG TPA: sigma-54 dependent transcriptional regulator, partial [Paludibacter sp.]